MNSASPIMNPDLWRQPPTPKASHPAPLDQLTSSSISTQLLVSLSQPSTLQTVKRLPIDGVGLLRSELMLINEFEQRHPRRWLELGKRAELRQRMVDNICQFAQAFTPRPIRYRSLDLRSHEFLSWEGGPPPEQNPMLGLRGTFSYLVDPLLFNLELEALRQVQQLGYSNVQLILPFVRTVKEFVFCRQRIEAAGLFEVPQFQLWIMAEVPSVLFLLPDYIRAGAQGIAIGTNDLTQLILGVDRDQAVMATEFDLRHPAVMDAIRQIIQIAQQAGVPCSLCGEAPAHHPEIIASLVRWGVNSISVNPGALERTYRAIAQAEEQVTSKVSPASNVR